MHLDMAIREGVSAGTVICNHRMSARATGDSTVAQDKATGPARTDKISKPDAEWKQALSPEAFHVTRKHGTERAFTSPLNAEKRAGMFECVCCGEPVF